jgi:uroporphyrinogen decarboxylase
MWDDVAGEYGLLFDPGIFKRHFLPIYKEMIESVKSKDLVFSWHCCGSVVKILPMMIDAGIDVFDVVQTSAKDMEIDNIYKRFGKDVCLHGGIDVKDLLVFGTPAQVKKEVEKIHRLWGNKGGMILTPSHDIVPGTPLENVLAIYS